MALTDTQKTGFLYKQGVAQVAETNTAIDYYSEQYSSRLFVYPTDVWSQKDSIPSTAPVLADGATSGVVQYFSARSMTYIAGTSGRGYYLSNLVDSIPFNFGTGYSPAVTTSTGTSIAFGVGEWVINPAAGTLYFYGTLPSGVNASGSTPPKVSFYKYIGTKSLAVPLQSSGTSVGAGYTQLNFGSGLSVSIASSVATVTATGGGGDGGSVIINDDITTNSSFYIGLSTSISGVVTSINTSSTKLTFNPSTGNMVVGGTVTSNSDEKLKTNIKTIENALDKVLSLRGVEFDRVDNRDHQIGLIAQEVENIIPEVVYPKQPTPDYEIKSVAYGNLIGLLIEAVKEQNKKIAELEKKLEDL